MHFKADWIRIFFFFYFILFVYQISAQQIQTQVQFRVPIQVEWQQAEISYSWGTDTLNATCINFGADALINFTYRDISIFGGIGLFRNRFNLKRGFDHRALNPGRDSLPLGTLTRSYTYSIIRIPLGADFRLIQNEYFELGIGVEYLLNFSFRRKYNGVIPVGDGNSVFKDLNYFGNSLNIFIYLAKSIRANEISIEPFIRVFNKYHKDRFLNENEKESITRNFDAIGINLKYSFTL